MNSRRQEGIVILGSTGSIGTSTLEVIRHNRERFRVIGLTCASNISLMAEQITEFNPEIVSVKSGQAESLRSLLKNKAQALTILEGAEGNREVAANSKADKLVAAIAGAAGMEAVMAGIDTGKTIALANKEALVLTGEIMIEAAHSHQVQLLPVDSEHNAIFQSLQGNHRRQVANITLTGSGGPFRSKPFNDFKTIRVNEALNHPIWDMGPKVTIDSATMMNKALEIIEARWLFDLNPNQIKVLVHPQSIVHSMVTYSDGSTIAQMGVPDMKIPIAYTLGYPERIPSGSAFLDLEHYGPLTFEAPDLNKFPTIQLAYDVLELGGGAPAALNGANEALVGLFLKEQVSFVDILTTLQKTVSKIEQSQHDGPWKQQYPYLYQIDRVQDAIKADRWGRDFIKTLINRKTN